MQVFGFAPAELAATQEQIGATFEISDKLRNRRTALLTNAYAATESGDDQAVSEAYDAIDKFNATNPDLMISPKSLRASFRERRRRAMEAVNGIYLPRYRSHSTLAREQPSAIRLLLATLSTALSACLSSRLQKFPIP